MPSCQYAFSRPADTMARSRAGQPSTRMSATSLAMERKDVAEQRAAFARVRIKTAHANTRLLQRKSGFQVMRQYAKDSVEL